MLFVPLESVSPAIRAKHTYIAMTDTYEMQWLYHITSYVSVIRSYVCVFDPDRRENAL